MAETLTGRDLDVAVAVALGWKWWRSSTSGCRCLFPPERRSSWFTTPADGSEPLVFDWDEMARDIPAYSVDRYPLVLEWLAAKGVVVILSTADDGGWECELNGHGAIAIVRAATAGDAVGLALLAHVEKWKDGE